MSRQDRSDPGQVLVAAVGRPRRRHRGARRRARPGVGPTGQGLEEPATGELVVGAGRGVRRDGVDAQLRADPAQLLRPPACAVRQWRSEAAFYAGNALSTTLPGGPVLSATFVYRQQRIWGASPVVASWQLVMSGVLQVVGLALLGLGGAFLLGASKNPLSLMFTLGGFIALLVLAQAVASRPELIDGIGVRVLSWVNSLRGKPADTGLAKWREMLPQLESVSLTAASARRGVQLVVVQLGRRCRLPAVRRVRRRRPTVAGRADGGLRGGPRRRLHPVDAGRAAGGRGGAGARPGVQRDDAGRRHLGDADLPAGQLDLHLRDRLGGVLLHVPHREGRSTPTHRKSSTSRPPNPKARNRRAPNRRRTPATRHCRDRCRRRTPEPSEITDAAPARSATVVVGSAHAVARVRPSSRPVGRDADGDRDGRRLLVRAPPARPAPRRPGRRRW